MAKDDLSHDRILHSVEVHGEVSPLASVRVERRASGVYVVRGFTEHCGTFEFTCERNDLNGLQTAIDVVKGLTYDRGMGLS